MEITPWYNLMEITPLYNLMEITPWYNFGELLPIALQTLRVCKALPALGSNSNNGFPIPAVHL